MKNMTRYNSSRGAQSGFTIIELVVVILLLGILTATALPRFLDVTDEAHQSVVDAVQGGLATGSALFRAAWFVANEDVTAAIPQFGDSTLFANSSGYPIGADNSFTDQADCAYIFTRLLQAGAPSSVGTAYDADAETWIETGASAAPTADFIITDDTGDGAPTGCQFAYVGQYRIGGDGTAGNLATQTVPLLSWASGTGIVTASTVSLNSN